MIGGLLQRLQRSTTGLRERLSGLGSYGPIDDGFWERVEETLVGADMGPAVGLRLAGDLRREAERLRWRDSGQAVEGLRTLILNRLDWRARGLAGSDARPGVYLIVGVNGTGKTTTAAKLAALLSGGGGRVVLGAADTYRAGAIEQLRVWAQRVGADIVAAEPGADPAAVAYTSVEAGISSGARAVVIDTAGRLHTQANLVAELEKIARSIGKAMPGAPHETLLVLDSALGQNSLTQARVFHDALQLTGVVLAKLDGSAKGGIVLAVEEELGVPVKLVGTGEAPADLQPFEAKAFLEAIFA